MGVLTSKERLIFKIKTNKKHTNYVGLPKMTIWESQDSFLRCMENTESSIDSKAPFIKNGHIYMLI